MMGAGSGNVCVDSVATGVQGGKDSSGFQWPEQTNNNIGGNVWTFDGCIAHNNKAHGIFTWQNDNSVHPVKNFVAYGNGDSGIDHGAYVNRYHYEGMTLTDNGSFCIQSHALGKGDESIIFEDITATEPLMIGRHTLEGGPVIYKNCKFPSVLVDEGNKLPSTQRFENCGVTPDDFDMVSIASGTRLEILEGGALKWSWEGDWKQA